MEPAAVTSGFGPAHGAQAEQKEDDAFDPGFKLPDMNSILRRLELAEKNELRRQHKEEMEKDETAGQKKKQKRGGAVCCCEAPRCRIRPFIEKNQ